MHRMSSFPRRRFLLAIVAAAVLAECGSGGDADADEGEAAGKEAAEANEEYPAHLSLRPLTLPQGMTQATLSGGYLWIDDGPNIAPVSIRATVGITDQWDASVRTFSRLKPDVEWGEGASLSTKVLVYDSARLDFAPGISVPINFDKADDAHLFPGVAVSATARAFIVDRYAETSPRIVSVTCGQNLLPLKIGRRASLDLNCSMVAQGNRGYGARISLQLFHIRLSGDVRESTFLKPSPTVTFFYSIGNWIDFAASYVGGGYEGVFGSVALRK